VNDRPQITGRHRYRNAAGAGPRRLGERETAARNDRIAEALGADVTIDLTQIDVAHLLVEHRAACAELRQLRTENAALRGAVRSLAGWIRELDPNPSLDPCDYLIDEAEQAAVRRAYQTEIQ
jgi:hypothetical protein